MISRLRLIGQQRPELTPAATSYVDEMYQHMLDEHRRREALRFPALEQSQGLLQVGIDHPNPHGIELALATYITYDIGRFVIDNFSSLTPIPAEDKRLGRGMAESLRLGKQAARWMKAYGPDCFPNDGRRPYVPIRVAGMGAIAFKQLVIQDGWAEVEVLANLIERIADRG